MSIKEVPLGVGRGNEWIQINEKKQSQKLDLPDQAICCYPKYSKNDQSIVQMLVEVFSYKCTVVFNTCT